MDLVECDNCGIETNKQLLQPSIELLDGYKVCPDCHRLELELDKRTCSICSPDNADSLTGTICKSCEKDGWKCYYDYYSGKTKCRKNNDVDS